MKDLQIIFNTKILFMNFLKVIISGTMLLGLIATETSATTITFEPGTVMFSNGTNITDQYVDYGVIFSNNSEGLEGNFSGLGWQENYIQSNIFYNLFRVDFIGSDLVTDVTVSFGDQNLNAQTHSLYAFDSNGSIMDVDSFFDEGHYNGIFDLTVSSSSTAEISSIIAYEQSFGAQRLEQIVYNTTPVPEPATMLLFGTGIVGLAGAIRRSKKK